MSLSSLDNALWAASLFGHVALVLVLILKRRVRAFPVFSAFIAYSAARTILLFGIYRFGSGHAYFLAYWLTGGLNYLFQVALIAEVGWNVLRPTGRWVLEAGQSFLQWASAGLILAAFVAFQMGPSQSRGLDLWDTRITVFTALMTCGLFLALMTAANRLGLRWQNQVFAVGQGLFVWSSIALLGDVAHTAFGWNRSFGAFDHLQMLAYLGVLVFWGVIFWLPARGRAELSPEIRAYLIAVAHKADYDHSIAGGPTP